MGYTDTSARKRACLPDDKFILAIHRLVERDGCSPGVYRRPHNDLVDLPRPEAGHIPGRCPLNPFCSNLYTGDLDPECLVTALRREPVTEGDGLLLEHIETADLRFGLMTHNCLDGDCRGFGGFLHPVYMAAFAALHNQIRGLPENLVLVLFLADRADDADHSLAVVSHS